MTRSAPLISKHPRYGARALDPDPQRLVDAAVRRALKASGAEFVFPVLSGAEAAALMQVAGILSPNGRLKKPYR